jgi:RNA polymerase sigma-70 factor (ECF subfamily)
MDGSTTTPAAAGSLFGRGPESSRTERWLRPPTRRREQLRLLADPATRAAAAQVLELQHPDTDAFGALYLRYAPYVATIGSRMLGRDDELDDLVQDVFMQVLRGLCQQRSAAFKGWLAQITIRSATRRLRKRGLRHELMTAETPAPHELLCTQRVTPEQRMLSREVYNQLDILPAKWRMIWVLRHVKGEPLHVIAARSGCSLSTVQRRLVDAQSTLEERFVQDFAL